MSRYCLDAVNADQITGWCLDPDPHISVAVEGRDVGLATCNLRRPDVAHHLPHEPHAATSGFVFNFRPEDVARPGVPRVAVEVQLRGAGWETTERVSVAWLAPTDRPVPQGPLPVELLRLLAELDVSFADPAWSDAQMLAAVEGLAFLGRHGSRTLPGLHRYLSWINVFGTRALYAELNFPRVNPGRSPSDKDASTVQSSGFEMLAIAHHMRVLASHGVVGDMLEFGCFKGFSTSMLSAAQYDIGRHLHVFDSFAGLPASPDDYYHAGDFAGGIDEVRRNVGEFGRLEAVTFHPGFFADSLPSWPRTPVSCLWMDVDLESSARDALQVFDCLDPRGALFSHECAPRHFVGRRVTSQASAADVVVPIMDAFTRANRPLEGRFIAGDTGAFWSPTTGIPVLAPDALERVRQLAASLS